MSVIFSPALWHKQNKTDRCKVYSKVMASANVSRTWMNRKVQKKNKTAALTSAWKGSGSSMLGPMTALLSSLSFLSRRPAAMTAACCSATLAASSSWKNPWERSRLWGSSKHKALRVFPPHPPQCRKSAFRSCWDPHTFQCRYIAAWWFDFFFSSH